MPRTAILTRLRTLSRHMAVAEAAGLPARAVLEHDASELRRRLTRREVLTAAGAAGLALALRPYARALTPGAPHIAIVGGGLAGLVAALRLQQAGQASTIYEAASRVGGRVDTDTGFFAAGQRVERGGELIDTGHKRLRKLIKELGLKKDDLPKAEAPGTEDFHHFFGEHYSESQVGADFAAVFLALKKDVNKAGYPTLYNAFTPHGLLLDQLSIAEWIELRVPGGLASPLGQLLAVAYDIEYGASPEAQSSLNLIYLLGFGSTPGNFALFGESDERFRVQGGNGRVPQQLGELLADQIRLGHRLVAAATLGDGRTRLDFETADGAREVIADRVVMTVPFSVLRAGVDLSALSLSPLKRTAIAELGMGTNSKLHVQFASRPWVAQGCNGETYADLGYQSTWEETRAQPGAPGILVDYTGSAGVGFGSGTPAVKAQQFLAQIEPVLPGLGSHWNGLASVDFWPGSPFQLGSYSYWKVGQYTHFAGVEGEPEGTVHFAGEHTSTDAQGYMEGAVESGERAADEIVDAL